MESVQPVRFGGPKCEIDKSKFLNLFCNISVFMVSTFHLEYTKIIFLFFFRYEGRTALMQTSDSLCLPLRHVRAVVKYA